MTRTAEGLDAVDCAGVLIANTDIPVPEYVPTEVVPGTTPLPSYPNTTAFMSGGCAISANTEASFSRFFSMGSPVPVDASAGEQTGPVIGDSATPLPSPEVHDSMDTCRSGAGLNSEETK